MYNVSSYSSVCQHCSVQCNYANNLALNCCCCCKAGEGRTKAWVFTGQRQIPSLPHVSRKTYAADLHLPRTSCCSHSTSKKGKVRLKALWHWKSWWRTYVSFPSKELRVHKDMAIIQLSTSLFSSVPLSSFPGPKPVSSKSRSAKGIPIVPFQLLSSSFSLFLKKKYRVVIEIIVIVTLFKIPVFLRCTAFQACLLHTNNIWRTLSRFQLITPYNVRHCTLNRFTENYVTWGEANQRGGGKKAIKNWL